MNTHDYQHWLNTNLNKAQLKRFLVNTKKEIKIETDLLTRLALRKEAEALTKAIEEYKK